MDEPYTLRNLMPAGRPPRRVSTPVIAALVAGALALVLIAAGTVGAVRYLDHRTPAAPARVVDGIPAPDPACRSDIEDVTDPWVTNGWWAGYVDGQPKQMTSQEAAAMSIGGHDMRGVWLCPPH